MMEIKPYILYSEIKGFLVKQVTKTLEKTWPTFVQCVLDHMALISHLVVASTIPLSSSHY
jgi:hypothetical protein